MLDPDGFIKLKTYFQAQLFRVREPLLINFVLTPFEMSQNSQDMVKGVQAEHQISSLNFAFDLALDVILSKHFD